MIIFTLTVSWLFSSLFFYFMTTPPTWIYPLSLHDALPISARRRVTRGPPKGPAGHRREADDEHVGQDELAVGEDVVARDRKSTRLNSSHTVISYAVFCLKKKKLEQLRSRRTH